MFKKGNKANVSLNKNVTIRFESWKNADAFNKFHFKLATNLVKKLSSAPNKYIVVPLRFTILVYLTIKETNITYSTYPKILSCLNINKAAGMDQIPAKFLKEAADVVAYPLSRFINLFVKLSIFLEECKIARLKPLFKKRSKTDPKNYTPFHFYL